MCERDNVIMAWDWSRRTSRLLWAHLIWHIRRRGSKKKSKVFGLVRMYSELSMVLSFISPYLSFASLHSLNLGLCFIGRPCRPLELKQVWQNESHSVHTYSSLIRADGKCTVLVYIQDGLVVTRTVGQQATHPAEKRGISFLIPLSSFHSTDILQGKRV